MENRKYYNYNKLSNIQKYYLIVNAAKIVQKRFNYLLDKKSGLHIHHIKPKSLYPDLVDDEHNLIKVPSLVHWTLHKVLLDYYKEINNEVAINKMSYVNLEDFINNFYKNKKKKFNFDVVGREIFLEVFNYCHTIIYSESYLRLLTEKCSSIEKTFSKKKEQSKNTDEYEQYKQKGKYYKEYRSELKVARKKQSDVKEIFRNFVKNHYLDLTENLLDMYGENIKDELDDCYEDFWDLVNTLDSIREELPNIPDEELREGLNNL